jgi:hypothetical protein
VRSESPNALSRGRSRRQNASRKENLPPSRKSPGQKSRFRHELVHRWVPSSEPIDMGRLTFR